MKKRKKSGLRLLFVTLAFVFFIGCSVKKRLAYYGIETISDVIDFGEELEEEQVTEKVVVIDEQQDIAEDPFDDDASVSFDDYDINKIANVTSNYAYECINDSEKVIYREIYAALTDFCVDVELSTRNTEIIDHAFYCVLKDHPEIFYVKGYSLKTYTRGDTVEKVTISGTYSMEKPQADSYAMAIEAYVQKCEASIGDTSDEYEIVKGVYEYIIYNTDYDLDAEENQNILSVFLNHRSVCQGYAKATQYILNDMGIFCTLVEGSGKNREAHVWNLVRVNGNYYYIDTTWGDASYSLVSSDENISSTMAVPDINYDYLCITTRDLLINHTIDDSVPLPICSSMEDNYYVRSGYYFSYVDDEQLREAFNRGYDNNLITIIIKCSDSATYNDMKEYLLTEEKVFDYIRNDSASYAEVEEQNEILFYL